MTQRISIKKPKDLDAYDRDSSLFAEADAAIPRIYSAEHLIKLIESDPNCIVEARVHEKDAETGETRFVSMDRKGFLEAVKQSQAKTMREGADAFSTDMGDYGSQGLVGDSFVPSLGGPFFKTFISVILSFRQIPLSMPTIIIRSRIKR
jgi:hypothetical protein